MTSLFALCLAMLTSVPTDKPYAPPSSAPTAAATVAPASSAVVSPGPLVSAQPSPSATPTASPSWLGAVLGESPKDLRSQLGKPREILSANVGDLWRYDIDTGNVTLEIVVDQNQVVSIAARVKPGKQSTLADPLGGALGMTAAAVTTARGTPIATYDNGDEIAYGDATGVRWFYSLDNGVVTGISESAPLPPPVSASVISDVTHDGSTVARAFLVKATTQVDATNAEVSFLQTLSCGTGGLWRVVNQEMVNAGGGFFDLYHVTCSTSGSLHDFYFDVSQAYAHP
jgi:hypothetical protein